MEDKLFMFFFGRSSDNDDLFIIFLRFLFKKKLVYVMFYI